MHFQKFSSRTPGTQAFPNFLYKASCARAPKTNTAWTRMNVIRCIAAADRRHEGRLARAGRTATTCQRRKAAYITPRTLQKQQANKTLSEQTIPVRDVITDARRAEPAPTRLQLAAAINTRWIRRARPRSSTILGQYHFVQVRCPLS